MEDYAVDLLIRMVNVYSPSGEEEGLADLLSEEMKSLGFEVERDAVGNVIGRLRGERPRLLLCGHMDTVPGTIPVKVEDGVLYGRGAVDAKAPLAAMIVAASQLVREGYKGAILVVGAVDEEGKGRGVKHLVMEGVDVDYAIFGEPTDVKTITIGYKGSLYLKITCETETGHSSAPWIFENAVEKAIEIWGLIKCQMTLHERHESHFQSLSTCLRRIEGGGVSSVIPALCEIHIDFRIPPFFTVEQVLTEISGLIEGYKAENPAVRVNVEVDDYTEPYLADKRSPLVKALSQAIWKVRRTRTMLVNKTGTGDMNVFGRLTEVPTVTYGPGDPHLDHTPNEHISISNYLESIKILKECLKGLYKLHQGVQVRTASR